MQPLIYYECVDQASGDLVPFFIYSVSGWLVVVVAVADVKGETTTPHDTARQRRWR
jgi:hypothetical protein